MSVFGIPPLVFQPTPTHPVDVVPLIVKVMFGSEIFHVALNVPSGEVYELPPVEFPAAVVGDGGGGATGSSLSVLSCLVMNKNRELTGSNDSAVEVEEINHDITLARVLLESIGTIVD